MLAVPLSPWRRGGQTPRDTAHFTPSPDMFLPRPLTRCVWGGAELFVGVARAATGTQNVPKAVFSTLKSGEGLCPFEPCSKGGTPPLRNPLPCPTVLVASAAKKVATFFGNICDRSCENVAYAEIINSRENAILSSLQKFVDFYFLIYWQPRTISTPDYAFANTRYVLVRKILAIIRYSLVCEWRMYNHDNKFKARIFKSLHGNVQPFRIERWKRR